MKKLFVYTVLLFFLVGFSFETIRFFSEENKVLLGCGVGDFDSENESSESEKSDEKFEKLNFLDGVYSFKYLIFSVVGLRQLNKITHINFCSSDYSQAVYSPPELA